MVLIKIIQSLTGDLICNLELKEIIPNEFNFTNFKKIFLSLEEFDTLQFFFILLNTKNKFVYSNYIDINYDDKIMIYDEYLNLVPYNMKLISYQYSNYNILSIYEADEAEDLLSRDAHIYFIIQNKDISSLLQLETYGVKIKKKYVLAACKKYGPRIVNYIPHEFLTDYDVISLAFQFEKLIEVFRLPMEIISNRSLILICIKNYGKFIIQASEYLRDDIEIVTEAIKTYDKAIYYASIRLQHTKEIVMLACNHHYKILHEARLYNPKIWRINWQLNWRWKIIIDINKLYHNDNIKLMTNEKPFDIPYTNISEIFKSNLMTAVNKYCKKHWTAIELIINYIEQYTLSRSILKEYKLTQLSKAIKRLTNLCHIIIKIFYVPRLGNQSTNEIWINFLPIIKTITKICKYDLIKS